MNKLGQIQAVHMPKDSNSGNHCDGVKHWGERALQGTV
jgi:hypothetical protein